MKRKLNWEIILAIFTLAIILGIIVVKAVKVAK